MADKRLEGVWWLPDRPERRIGGSIVIDERRIHLILQDALVPYEPPTPENGVIEHIMSTDDGYPVIFGDLRDGRRVTAFRASGSNVRGPFSRVTEVYRLNVLLIGNYVSRDAFEEVRFEFDYLPLWIGAPSLSGADLRKLDGHIVDSLPITLAEVETFGATLRIVCSCSGSYNAERIDLSRRVYVSVRPSASGTVVELLNFWAASIQDYLSVTLGCAIRLTELTYRPVEADPYGDKMVAAWLPLVPGVLSGTEYEVSSNIDNYTSPTLASGRGLGEALGQRINSWVETWNKNRNIVGLLLSHYYAPFMYTSHKYSSTFQAVEGLHASIGLSTRQRSRPEHRKRVKAIIDAATREEVPEADVRWAERVLQSRNDQTLAGSIDAVVESTGSAGRLIHEHDPDFGENCATLRGLVSHPSAQDRSDVAVAMYWYGQALDWIARIVLLKMSGIDGVESVARAHFSFEEVVENLCGVPKSDFAEE